MISCLDSFALMRVWKAISTIGFGQTITYSELARRAGCTGSARGAGTATGRNPITIIIPLPPDRRFERQPYGICGRARQKARAACARGGDAGVVGGGLS
jgi:hypothetical protein